MTVEKTDTGFSVYSNRESIFTTGNTIPELINNAYEAAELYFEVDVKLERNDIKFEIDLQQFFKYYKVWNAKFLEEKIGMNATLLSQYAQGHKNHPRNKPKKFWLEFIKSEKSFMDLTCRKITE